MKPRLEAVRANLATRTSHWVWLAVLVTSIASGSMSWLHIQHHQQLDVARYQMQSLHKAHLELLKGFVDLGMYSMDEGEEGRARSITAIDSAIDKIETNIGLIGAVSEREITALRDASAAFKSSVHAIDAASPLRPEQYDELRRLFGRMDGELDQSNLQASSYLGQLNARMENEFALVVITNTLLLAGVCLVVILSERRRSRSSQALRQSEARFRSLFENNHTPMLLIDPQGGAILDANPTACAFFGWPQAEITSKTFQDFTTQPAEQTLNDLGKAARKEIQYFLYQQRLQSGELRDLEIFSGPLEVDGKTVLFSIAHDISQLKNAERAIRENEIRLRFALEGANDGLWDTQMQSGTLYLSPRGCELLGYTPDEFNAAFLDWPALVHPDDMPAMIQRLNEHFSGALAAFEVEQRIRHKTGSWIWVLTRGKLVERDEQGRPLRMAGTYTDITNRKQIEEKNEIAQLQLQELLAEADESRQVLLSVVEDQKIAEEKLTILNMELEQRVSERTAQLVAANQELEAFAYSVSHDLRAPLRGIDGWSLALMEDYQAQLDEKAREYLNRVRSETQRMGLLIDALLGLSKVTRMEMRRSLINLSEMAWTVATRLEGEKGDKPVVVIIQPDMNELADANLLDIVLTNLLSNAYKFSGKQNQARIEFGRQLMNGRLTYYIRDNGAGFDMEYAKNLFGAFQRMHRQSEFPGTGIGLATVQRIILRHGGRIWADAHKNQGATFYFTLGGEE